MSRNHYRWALLALACLAALFLARLTVSHLRARMLNDRGWRYFRDGDFPAAINSFSRALASASSLAEASMGLGEAYFILYRRRPQSAVLLEKAEKHYHDSLGASPVHLPSLMRAYHLALLKGPKEEGDLIHGIDEAVGLSHKYLHNLLLQKNFILLMNDLALMPVPAGLLARPQTQEAVIAAAGRLFKANMMDLAGIAPLILERHIGARGLLEMVQGSRDAQEELVRYLSKSGRWDEEKEIFLKAARSLPKSTFPRAMAASLKAAGRREEALEVLVGYLEGHDDDADAHYDAADLALGVKGYGWDYAEAHYLRAVELRPGYAGYRRKLGIMFYNRREHSRALAQLEEAEVLNPGNPVIPYYAGLAYEALGMIDEAGKAYRRAVELAPKNGQYRKSLEGLTGK